MHTITFDKKKFITLLFNWFQKNKRDLPWRKTYTPYQVWISEMMLQQTQMERGVQYFKRWMQELKNPTDIANAPLEKILHLWEGLGYYSRAKNIHEAAKIIRDQYNGIIPCDEEKIKALPGIGDYTLCAIMGIAFEKNYATIDANVERVFSRLFNCTDKNLKKAIQPLVQELLPANDARNYNQALMELGALVCKKNPLCSLCPLTPFCESKKLGVEKERPIPKEKKEHIPVLASFCIITNNRNQELIRHRTKQKLWNNMWEYPGIDNIQMIQPKIDKAADITQNELSTTHAKTNSNKKMIARQGLVIELSKLLPFSKTELEKQISNEAFCIKSNYTNHKLTAYFFSLQLNAEQEAKLLEKDLVTKSKEQNFHWTDKTQSFAMPSHHRKAYQKNQNTKYKEKSNSLLQFLEQ